LPPEQLILKDWNKVVLEPTSVKVKQREVVIIEPVIVEQLDV
jgi:hypothetical protein